MNWCRGKVRNLMKYLILLVLVATGAFLWLMNAAISDLHPFTLDR